MPGPLGRPTEPADYVKDALVALILLSVGAHDRDSVRDEYVENALEALIEIMKIEGVDVEEYFAGEERRIAVTNALSEFVISGIMFNKIRNDGRHYFEQGFAVRARRLVRENLSQEIQEAAKKALPSVMPILTLGSDGKARVAEYKAEKQAARV